MKHVAILCVLLLILAGCSFKELSRNLPKLPGIEQEEKQVTFGGSDGITTKIVNPKDNGKVIGSSLEPVVRVSNVGGYRAEGQTCITGLNAEQFSGFSGCECQTFSFGVKDEQTNDLKFGPYAIKKESNSHTITAITRYRYGTDIKAKICVADDIYDNNNCRADIVSVTSGPISVNSIEEEINILRDNYVTIMFLINIETEAKGRVFDLKSINSRCVPMQESPPIIKAEIANFPVTGNIKCEQAEVKDGEATIVCQAEGISLYDSRGHIIFEKGYRPEITFKLEYGFETVVSNSFEVVG